MANRPYLHIQRFLFIHLSRSHLLMHLVTSAASSASNLDGSPAACCGNKRFARFRKGDRDSPLLGENEDVRTLGWARLLKRHLAPEAEIQMFWGRPKGVHISKKGVAIVTAYVNSTSKPKPPPLNSPSHNLLSQTHPVFSVNKFTTPPLLPISKTPVIFPSRFLIPEMFRAEVRRGRKKKDLDTIDKGILLLFLPPLSPSLVLLFWSSIFLLE